MVGTTIRQQFENLTKRTTSLADNVDLLTLTNHDLLFFKFKKDVEGHVYGMIPIPSNLALLPNAKVVLIIGSLATSGATRLRIDYALINENNENYDFAFTTGTAQNVTPPSTARRTKEVSFSIPSAGARALLFIDIVHDGTHASDTLTEDTELLAAMLEIDIL